MPADFRPSSMPPMPANRPTALKELVALGICNPLPVLAVVEHQSSYRTSLMAEKDPHNDKINPRLFGEDDRSRLTAHTHLLKWKMHFSGGLISCVIFFRVIDVALEGIRDA